MHWLGRYPIASIVLLLGWLYTTEVQAQSAHALVEAIRQGQGVRQNLRKLWEIDSLQSFSVAKEVQSAFEELGAKNGKPQADTLLRIFAIGYAQDPYSPEHWLVQRALVGLRYKEAYPRHIRQWAMEAVAAMPLEVPRMLIEAAGHTLAAEYKSKQIPLNVAAADWASLDRALLLRQLSDGKEAAEWAKLQSQLSLELRSVFPDCNQLVSGFAEAISRKSLSQEDCIAFLVIYHLQGCDGASLWETVLDMALPKTKDAWLYRLAGSEAFNRGQWTAARGFWQQACSVETSVALKAHDHLQIAATFRAEKDYRQARSSILRAMQEVPDWGEPYVELMDLYLEGSQACGFSAFDQKALSWLLMDLCQRLKAVDENYAAEADERYYRYLQSSPSREEAAFLGWKVGDTYPLPCWMSTSTSVK